MGIENFRHRGEAYRKITYEPVEKMVVGVDLGHAVDPTAISVMRYKLTPLDTFTMTRRKSAAHYNINEQNTETRFEVPHLERLPLGISYPQQAAYIVELLARDPLKRVEVDLVVDATGVGLPVVQILEEQGLKPIKVTITAGAEQTSAGGNHYHVAKSILISHLDAALHTGELHFAPELLEAPAMKEELSHFDRHIGAAGRATYAARTGAHDDLVLAVALCMWRAKGGGPGVVRTSGVSMY